MLRVISYKETAPSSPFCPTVESVHRVHVQAGWRLEYLCGIVDVS
jgi:hypothetical protein